MKTTDRRRAPFIEAIEPRLLLTVFAPDLNYQPPKPVTIPGYFDPNPIPVSKERYIVATEVTDDSGGDIGDTTATYSRVFADGRIDKTFGINSHLVFDISLLNVQFTGSRFIVTSPDNAQLSIYTFNGKPDETVGNGTGMITFP